MDRQTDKQIEKQKDFKKGVNNVYAVLGNDMLETDGAEMNERNIDESTP